MTEELIKLYTVSKALNQLKWWEFCQPDMPVIVETPQQMVYCIFSSAADEQPSLMLYLGDYGLFSYTEMNKTMEEGPDSLDFFKASMRQEGIVVNFEDRKDLEKEAYERIKALGLSFRGKKQWPTFQRLKPGSLPTMLEDEKEVCLVTMVLEQLMVILEEVRRGKLAFYGEEGKMIQASLKGRQWQRHYVAFQEVVTLEKLLPYHVKYGNDIMAHRIKKLPYHDQTLEAVQFFAPVPTRDEELGQEMLPLLTVFVDEESEFVFNPVVTNHELKSLMTIPDALATLLLKELKFRPRRLLVSDLVLLSVLKDFCKRTGIGCEYAETPIANELVESFIGEALDQDADEEEFENFEKLVQSLLGAGDEIYGMLLKKPRISKLSSLQKDTLKAVLNQSLTYMMMEHDQFIFNWEPVAFKDLIQSGALVQALDNRFRKHIYPMLLEIVKALQELNLNQNTKELITVFKEVSPI